MNSIRIVDDIKNMTAVMKGNTITVDMRKCNNIATCKIVLLNVIRLQANIKSNRDAKSRPVEVRIAEKDIRYFRIAEHIDEFMLQSLIFKDRILQNFLKGV